MIWIALPLVPAFLLDLLLGDPRWMYHPVCLLGNLISLFEKVLRRIFPKTKRALKVAGGLLVFLTGGSSLLLSIGLMFLLYRLNFWVGFAAEVFFCYQLLAAKSLRNESMSVYHAVKTQGVEEARKAVGMIVGRDTSQLTETGVIKATVETVAENTSDGVIAPMFYMSIAGLPLMFLYKAINTMDSMVGYKNEKYRDFGCAAAKLDDLANFIPARISALCMLLGTRFCAMNTRNAWKIFRRDRYQHASPNSAQTESVMAGALEVQLAGNAVYFGTVYEKPTIGDAIQDIEAEDIVQANRLMYAASAIALLLFSLLRALIIYIIV
ncbi:MAG: adenosylcobinamide-phosphate synthase CbiB [Lachnospiraceae bacterium]